MFEPSSAMTLIAEDGEFRFARFYIVCEAVPLGTLGNPLIVCGLSDTFRGLSKRGRDTESDAKIRSEEMHAFFSTNVPSAFPAEIEGYDFFLPPITSHVKNLLRLDVVPTYRSGGSRQYFRWWSP